MKKSRRLYFFRLPNLLLLLLLITGLGLFLQLSSFTHAKPTESEAPQQEEESAEEPETDAESDGNSGADLPWDESEVVGDEGEMVEVIYDEGWELVGERVLGVNTTGAPPFQVPARKVEDIPMYPCSECHKGHNVNNRKRELKKDHLDIKLTHGKGRFWCDGCHDGRQMDQLLTIDGTYVDMDLSYLLCGQCHFREMEDWQHGVHGKRIGFWQGERVFRICTECHMAHSPAFIPVAPDPPPLPAVGHPASRLKEHHLIRFFDHLTGGVE